MTRRKSKTHTAERVFEEHEVDGVPQHHRVLRRSDVETSRLRALLALLERSANKQFGVDRRIIVAPRKRGGHLRFDDQRLIIQAPSAAIALRVADEVKHSRDWDGVAQLNPKEAW